MKKALVFITYFLLLICNAFAQNYEGARIAIFSPEIENVQESYTWLPDLVRQKLSSNISTYTSFKLIDIKNENEIKKIQKNYTGAAFDESTSIEIGQMSGAQYAIFSTITKASSKYILSCNFTNLTTGETIAITLPSKKEATELYEGSNCSVNEFTIKFCESLKIELSSTQRYILQYGEAGLSNDEQIRLAREEEATFKKQIEEFNIQIKELSKSSSLTESAKAQQIQAEKAIAEEKLRSAKEKQERLIEEAKKQEEDRQFEAIRTEKQKQKRDELAKLAEQKAQESRKTRLENQPILSQITVIEAKKKALFDIRNNIEYQVKESNETLTKEMNEKIAEKEQSPYRIAETDSDGNPTPQAITRRVEEISKIADEYKNRMQIEEKKIRDSTKTHEDALVKEIYSDYNIISKTKTISSLESDLKYSIGKYNGLSNSWPVKLYIYSNGISLSQEEFNLKYTDLTRTKSIPSSGAAYDEYVDNVDLYDSFFRRSDPILTFEVDYKAEAKPDNRPSEYTIYFLSIRIKDTVNNEKLLSTITPATKQIDRTMTPPYDIRTFATQKQEKEKIAQIQQQERQKLLEEQKAKEAAEQKRREREEKKENKKIARDNRYNEYIHSHLISLRTGVGANKDGYDEWNMGIKFSKIGFIEFDFGCVNTPEELKDIFEYNTLFKFNSLLGFELMPKILYYPPTIFVAGTVGAISGKTIGTWITKDKDDKDKETSTANYLTLGFSGGIEIPIVKRIYMLGQFNYNYVVEGGDSIINCQVGLGVNLF